MGGPVDGFVPVRIELLTLRYSPTLGAIDDAPLQALRREHELLSLREHLFVVDEVPHLLCVVRCRPHAHAAAAPRTPAPAPRTPAPTPRAPAPTSAPARVNVTAPRPSAPPSKRSLWARE